jgi:fructosamine-3-kinase
VQPNKWTKSWADFFVEHRLGHMFKLCRRDGASFTNEKEVLQKVSRPAGRCPPNMSGYRRFVVLLSILFSFI